MTSLDPTVDFAAFAAGGTWPAAFGTSESSLIVCLDDVSVIEPLFTLHTVGYTFDVDFAVDAVGPDPDLDALVGLTLSIGGASIQLRLLFWANAHRAALEALRDASAIVLASRTAFEAAPSPEPHPEMVSVTLPDIDLSVLDLIYDRVRATVRRTATGWSVATPIEGVDGAVELRRYEDAAAYEAATAALAAQPVNERIGIVDDASSTIGVAGLATSVAACLASLPAGASSANCSEQEVRALWARFVLHARSEVVGPAPGDPVVSAVRLWLGERPAALIALFVAYAYADARESRAALDRLSTEVYVDGTAGRLMRVLVGDPEARSGDDRWVVMALVLDHRKKDEIARFDWGAEAVCVTRALGDLKLVLIERAFGVERHEIRIESMPTTFGPTAEA